MISPDPSSFFEAQPMTCLSKAKDPPYEKGYASQYKGKHVKKISNATKLALYLGSGIVCAMLKICFMICRITDSVL